MLSFENFVKSMLPSLLELKVTTSFGFAFKIPDHRAASSIYVRSRAKYKAEGEELGRTDFILYRSLALTSSQLFKTL